MATLVSPGVAVSITDESQYGGAGQGTVPLIILATQTNKLNTSASGYAVGTTPANANRPYLLTSQRELVEMFGQPRFRIVDGTPIHGDETNEYGLLAAYSFLGVANRAYVLRADIDLAQMEPSDVEPTRAPKDGTVWFDLSSTSFGVFESTGSAWVSKSVSIVTGSGVPSNSIGNEGEYCVLASSSASYTLYKKGSTTWNVVTASHVSPHYEIPSASVLGSVWIKTTSPNNGMNLVVKKYSSASISAPWTAMNVPVYSGDAAATAAFGAALSKGKVYAGIATGAATLTLRMFDGANWGSLNEVASVTTPTQGPADGTLWFNTSLYADLYVKANGAWEPVIANVTIDSTAPSVATGGDIWVDSSDLENYPMIYQYDGANWTQRDTTDQTTPNGVLFADLTKTAGDTSSNGGATPVDDEAPDPLFFPDGMLCWNSMVSTGNVKQYSSATGVWSTFSGKMADGRPYMMRKAQRAAVVRAMQAAVNGNTQIREEMTYFSLLAAPGYPELLDEMLALNVDRKETAFIIVDTPLRLSPQASNLLDWMSGNNATVNGEDGIITSTAEAAAYYPSGITSDLSGNDVVVPASHIVLRTMAYNDQVAYPWFAPAGLTRGVVTNATNVGYINGEGEFVPVALTTGQRDTLYGDGSRVGINPITRFPGQGLFVFGQRTLQSFSSALDRVNVARLLAYLRERFDPLARPFIFEPNDRITRTNVRQVFVSFLNDLMTKRAIYDFIVVCDETNNTPARIDRNELWIDVAIEPTKAAEFIYIPIRVVNTGELS